MFLLPFSQLFWVGFFCRSFPSLVFPAQRSSFSICCRHGLVVLNSLNFCLSVKLLISLSNLNDILAVYSNLGCRFFPFITVNISCHALLACQVSAERSAGNLRGIPFFNFIYFILFIYFLPALGLHSCAWVFSSYGEQ